MPKYTIELKKLLIQNLEVEANSAAEALDDAHEDTHYSVTNQFGDVLESEKQNEKFIKR